MMRSLTPASFILASTMVLGVLQTSATNTPELPLPGGGAPVNDLCSSVTPQALVAGATLTFTGDNTGATATGDFVSGSPFDGAPVVWHAFTTSTCTNVTVSYCGQNPVWGSTFGILSTTCPADQIIFTSAFNSTECVDGNVTYHFDQLAAGTYYLPVVLDAINNAVGPYSIDVSAAACGPEQGSDICASLVPEALAVGSTLTFTGDNSSATSTGDFVPGSPFDGAPVVWHAFTTTQCADIIVSYCGQTPTWNNTLGILSTTCPADQVIFLSASNNTDCADGNMTYTFGSLSPGTYYLPVLNDPGNNASGPYSIAVSANPCPDFQGSDFCQQVVPLALATGSSLTFTGDNSGATANGDFATGSPFDGAPVVWHAFTTTGCADITVSYCGQNPVWGNTLGILSTTCPADQVTFLSGSNNTDCVDGNVTYLFSELAGGTYYLPVLNDPGNNASGPYTITVSAAPCPTNQGSDFCQQVTPVPLNVGTPLTFTGDNTNATGNGDFAVGSPFTGAPVVWHAFTTTECATIMVAYCGQTPAWTSTLGIVSTTCPADQVIFTSSFNTVDCVDGNTTYTFSELADGTYYLPVLSDAGNGSSGPYSITLTATACSALGLTAMGTTDWSVFPNPSEGDFTVLNGGDASDATIDVLDMAGRLMYATATHLGQGATTTLHLQGKLAPGIYTLRIRTAGGSLERRLVVR